MLKKCATTNNFIPERCLDFSPPAYENKSEVSNIPFHNRHLVAQKRRARIQCQVSRNVINRNNYNILAQQFKRELENIRIISFIASKSKFVDGNQLRD